MAIMMQDYDWDFAGAEKQFQVAIELNPGYATARQWYGEFCLSSGRQEEGLREILLARDLDPLSPRISAEVGYFLCLAGRYDQALEELNRALEVDPHHFVTHEFLGWVYEATGKYEDAVNSYLRAIELGGGSKDPEADLASCYALMGKREEARKILDHLIEYSQGHFVSSVVVAFVLAALEEKDQAFAWLEKAFRERDPYILDLRNYQRFVSLRSDPRFTALLRKIGLEK